MSKPPLIINGDDFGYSRAVNTAIIRAHREGVLTSASLMVNEEAAGEAVELARANPSLGVGLHLSLVLGKSALSHNEIPHLVDECGNFSNSPGWAGVSYFFRPAARKELKREMRAQFERFARTGLPFSHVDGHNHLHMHPVVFRELLALCEEFGVRRLRIVTGETGIHLKVTREDLIPTLIMSRIFHSLSRHCLSQISSGTFVVPATVHGLFRSGRLTEDYLVQLVNNLELHGGEIYLHPRTAKAGAAERLQNPGGEVELEALVGSRLRNAIDKRGFRLASYESY